MCIHVAYTHFCSILYMYTYHIYMHTHLHACMHTHTEIWCASVFIKQVSHNIFLHLEIKGYYRIASYFHFVNAVIFPLTLHRLSPCVHSVRMHLQTPRIVLNQRDMSVILMKNIIGRKHIVIIKFKLISDLFWKKTRA